MERHRITDRGAPRARMDMVQFGDMNQCSQSDTAVVGRDAATGWALGLRRLYEGVAEEPVPTDLDTLLARLQLSLRDERPV